MQTILGSLLLSSCLGALALPTHHDAHRHARDLDNHSIQARAFEIDNEPRVFSDVEELDIRDWLEEPLTDIEARELELLLDLQERGSILGIVKKIGGSIKKAVPIHRKGLATGEASGKPKPKPKPGAPTGKGPLKGKVRLTPKKKAGKSKPRKSSPRGKKKGAPSERAKPKPKKSSGGGKGDSTRKKKSGKSKSKSMSTSTAKSKKSSTGKKAPKSKKSGSGNKKLDEIKVRPNFRSRFSRGQLIGKKATDKKAKKRVARAIRNINLNIDPASLVAAGAALTGVLGG